MAEHGVRGSANYRENGFAQVTEAEYLGWKGKNTWKLKSEMGLGSKDNLRDHLCEYELDQLAFLEATVEEKVRRENAYGASQCSELAHGVGKAVCNVVKAILGPDPA